MSRINTNVAANNAYRNLSVVSGGLDKSIQKLSSGFRINRSSDDAAGLSIANKLRAEGRAMQQASRNAAQGAAVLQVADGAVTTVSGILDRMKELAAQSASGNVSDADRTKIHSEFDALRSEIQRIAITTEYQGSKLVNGSFGASITTNGLGGVAGVTAVRLEGASGAAAPGTDYVFTAAGGNISVAFTRGGVNYTEQVAKAAGAGTAKFSVAGLSIEFSAAYVVNTAAGTVTVTGGTGSFLVSSSGDYSSNDLVQVSAVDLRSSTLGLDDETLSTQGGAQTALTGIDLAIDAVNTAIGTLGAAQSRFEYASANVASTFQNVVAAESVIRDADMAFEMTAFTKNQILQQAGTAMLAQANSAPQAILSLIRG